MRQACRCRGAPGWHPAQPGFHLVMQRGFAFRGLVLWGCGVPCVLSCVLDGGLDLGRFKNRTQRMAVTRGFSAKRNSAAHLHGRHGAQSRWRQTFALGIARGAALRPTRSQKSLTISQLFEQIREELDEAFTKPITTDIAHDGTPRRPDAIYGCWLIFRQCLLPLFLYQNQLREVIL